MMKHHDHNDNSYDHQAGSVLHLILIGIVLFAAVSAVVTQSGKGGQILKPEKAKLYAGQIINYANQVSQAVRRVMMVNDCLDTQISFERSPFDGSDTLYVNSLAPSDFSCHVFHPNGGNTSYLTPDSKWQATDAAYNIWLMSGRACFHRLGLGAEACTVEGAELYASLYGLKKEVCEAINKQFKLNVEPDGAADSISSGAFRGVYYDEYFIGDSVTDLNSKKAFCIKDSDGSTQDEYVFLSALIVR